MYVILNNGNLVQKYNVEYAKYAHPVYPTLFPEYYPTLEGEISKITAEGFAYETIKNHKNGLPWSNAVYTASGTQVDGNSYSYYNSGHLGYGQPVQVVKSDNGSKSLYTYDYTYDKHGNILTQIEYREFESENQNYDSPGTDYYTEMVRNVSYEYDNLDRLTKETVDGVEKTYTYDAAGNITTKTTIDKTYVFSYNNSWKDQLSKLTVNGVEEVFEYNSIGLPTKYRNEDVIWDKRNLLADYKNVLFTYDGTGMRLAKSTYVEIIDDDGTKRREITGTTTFDYDGDRLLSESRNGAIIRYIYGASGMLGFVYNNSNYYFVRNLQGDVTRIVDTNNQIFAQYTYDAWGNCTIVSETNGIGTLNAIRYRGYYFDSETGLYYLQTRYYDPEIGRFISPDSTKYLDPETLGGLNLYAYCNNNPVMYADPSGCSILAFWLIVGIAALAGATIGGIQSYQSGERGWDIIQSIALGFFIGGAIAGAAIVLTSATWIAVFGAKATIIGVEAIKAFAVGAVAVNTFSYIGATFYGAKTEMLELPTL